MAKTTNTQRAKSRKSSKGLGRGYVILAVGTVAALLIGTLTIVFEDFFSQSGSETTVNADDATDEVEAQLRSDMTANPNDPLAIAGLANYLSQVGKIDVAIPLYEQALAISPDDWNLRLDFAQSLATNEKRADAELQYQKVIAAEPNLADAYFGLGLLYASWVPARTADAIAAFEKTRSVDPQSFVAERASEELSKLGIGTPIASPVATPVVSGTPTGG